MGRKKNSVVVAPSNKQYVDRAGTLEQPAEAKIGGNDQAHRREISTANQVKVSARTSTSKKQNNMSKQLSHEERKLLQGLNNQSSESMVELKKLVAEKDRIRNNLMDQINSTTGSRENLDNSAHEDPKHQHLVQSSQRLRAMANSSGERVGSDYAVNNANGACGKSQWIQSPGIPGLGYGRKKNSDVLGAVRASLPYIPSISAQTSPDPRIMSSFQSQPTLTVKQATLPQDKLRSSIGGTDRLKPQAVN